MTHNAPLSNNPPLTNILIFDSGIGGLSIADEVTQAMPQHPIVYIADNRLYPYGIQTDDALLTRAKKLFPALESHYQPAVIIIACNSASTLILDEVRAITQTPVIGVVPAIKPAADVTQTGKIGLLATKGTISRQYTLDLITEFASQHQVTKIGSDVLVSQAER
ncbi:MAG: aspartate/glutamate racemase family protein, partial [Pseudomonadales bacterium]|nr:aspartate/glutamate racemase family protein [Pseudomonadales bacterium]